MLIPFNIIRLWSFTSCFFYFFSLLTFTFPIRSVHTMLLLSKYTIFSFCFPFYPYFLNTYPLKRYLYALFVIVCSFSCYLFFTIFLLLNIGYYIIYSSLLLLFSKVFYIELLFSDGIFIDKFDDNVLLNFFFKLLFYESIDLFKLLSIKSLSFY